uniref:Uncharacterized protein n=1 Tax=Anguilla anguilla TaxID=7936 RepID=A0A0E9VIM5_ANGAN
MDNPIIFSKSWRKDCFCYAPRWVRGWVKSVSVYHLFSCFRMSRLSVNKEQSLYPQ